VCSSDLGGGCNNRIRQYDSAILGGRNNYITPSYNDVMIVGNNITGNRSNTTFVNNLSIVNIPTSNFGLPTGSVWRNGTVLEIVP